MELRVPSKGMSWMCSIAFTGNEIKTGNLLNVSL